MREPPVILDANIVFSALLREKTRFAEVILGGSRAFYVGESLIVELFEHKERIVALSRLTGREVVGLFEVLLRRLVIYREALIDPGHLQAATRLCAGIDPADAQFVALTLELDGLLWTGDRKLKHGLRTRGFDRFFEP